MQTIHSARKPLPIEPDAANAGHYARTPSRRRRSLKYWFATIVLDAERYGGQWWKYPGFWATLSYRVRWFRRMSSLYAWLLFPVEAVLTVIRMLTSHSEISWKATIGAGLHLPHPNGVILAGGVRIGRHVTLFQQVTLGEWDGGTPRVRPFACVFAGAKVIGGVTVGRRAFVGANAVVINDVPPWNTAVGVPAKNHPRRGDGHRHTHEFGIPR